MEPHVSRTSGKIRDALKQIAAKIADRIKATWDAEGLAKVDSDTDALVDRLIRGAALDDDFLLVPSFVGPELERGFKTSGYSTLANIGLGDDATSTDFVDTRAVEYSKRRGAELVGKRVLDDGSIVENPNPQWTIADSTRDMLRGTITEAVEDGWSSQRLADEIEESAAFSAARSETIARTELAFAAVDAHTEVSIETGAVAKAWLLGSEHDGEESSPDICDECADAGVIGLNEEFAPGITAAPAHPRCVCDIEYLYDDDPRAKDFVTA